MGNICQQSIDLSKASIKPRKAFLQRCFYLKSINKIEDPDKMTLIHW